MCSFWAQKKKEVQAEASAAFKQVKVRGSQAMPRPAKKPAAASPPPAEPSLPERGTGEDTPPARAVVKAEPKSPGAPPASVQPEAKAKSKAKAKAEPKDPNAYKPIPKDAAKRMAYKLKGLPDLANQYAKCISQQEKRKIL